MNGPQSHRATELNDLNQLTERIIGCAIAVHKALGPGLLEAVYESALCIELDEAGLALNVRSSFPRTTKAGC